MITNFVQFISKLFGYSSKSATPERRTKPAVSQKKTAASSTLPTSKKQVINHVELKHKTSQKSPAKTVITKETLAYYQQHKQTQNQPHINKPDLMNRIKKNIVFLDQLMITLEAEVNYRPYYVKVQDLKTQSEGCFKIVHRIKDEAPYLNKTLLVVNQHTNTVSKLLKIK